MHRSNRFYGEVSFRHRNILQINDRTLETPDMFPEELGQLVTLISGALRAHMPEIAKHDAFDHLLRPHALVPPVILIARFALISHPQDVLTQHAQLNKQRHIVGSESLNEDALLYWTAIERTDFQPQVHVITDAAKDHAGIWLGVSEKA